MSSNQLLQDASVTIGVSGLSVACHNDALGRWEIAIPRFDDHQLSLEVTGLGTFFIEPQVKLIEIKGENSAALEPRHEPGQAPDRTQLSQTNSQDLRWLTDFSSELPHQIVSVVTKADNPQRVDVTMLYVHDAIAYTKSIDSSMLIRPDLDSTAPLVDGRAKVEQTTAVLDILEGVPTAVFEARVMGLDIQSPKDGRVGITMDNGAAMTIPLQDQTQQILITNVEPPGDDASRFIDSDQFHFGLGDLYRYYELFNVTGEKVHEWGKQPKTGAGPNRNCCCNTVQVGALPNLGGLP